MGDLSTPPTYLPTFLLHPEPPFPLPLLTFQIAALPAPKSYIATSRVKLMGGPTSEPFRCHLFAYSLITRGRRRLREGEWDEEGGGMRDA